jgi:hypothetical protein
MARSIRRCLIAALLMVTVAATLTDRVAGQSARGTTPATAPAERSADTGATARATIADLGWLAGNWTGGEAGPTYEERWTTPAGGAMLAVSRTLKSGRMTAFEFLRIVERDGSLVYVAQPGGRPPTDFAMTAIDGHRVRFENPAHDFPKVIEYSLKGGTLTATVGDGATQETYVFTRMP